MTVDLSSTAHGDSGPPVVILHGLLGSARNWSSFARQLGTSHRVFALDLRNHGGSPWADRMTYDQMADDVRTFLDRHELPSATLIGHSMGGKVAMRLALGHGSRVDHVVVVDIAPVTYWRSFNIYVDAMRQLDLTKISRRSEADAALAAEIAEPGVRGFLLQNLVSGEDGLAWRVPLQALADNMPALMGFPTCPAERYDGPALFVTGGNSDYVRPEHHATITALFPNARFAAIEGAGHWVQAEAPAAFSEVVTDFLIQQNH